MGDELREIFTWLGGGAAGAGGWLVAFLLWKEKRASDREILNTLKNVAVAGNEVANALDELRYRLDGEHSPPQRPRSRGRAG